MITKINEFNANLAARITTGVATMWCAYAFALVALISLPAAIKSGDLITIVAWVAQTFLQLVLLSIIMVGQNVASASVEQKINETHAASLSEFELAKEARAFNLEETKELKQIASDIHRVLKDIELKTAK
ncbi:MAG TPA: hypothetical protein VIH79_00225 [Candidatus Nanopelagicaceae bacterium]